MPPPAPPSAPPIRGTIYVDPVSTPRPGPGPGGPGPGVPSGICARSADDEVIQAVLVEVSSIGYIPAVDVPLGVSGEAA